MGGVDGALLWLGKTLMGALSRGPLLGFPETLQESAWEETGHPPTNSGIKGRGGQPSDEANGRQFNWFLKEIKQLGKGLPFTQKEASLCRRWAAESLVFSSGTLGKKTSLRSRWASTSHQGGP